MKDRARQFVLAGEVRVGQALGQTTGNSSEDDLSARVTTQHMTKPIGGHTLRNSGTVQSGRKISTEQTLTTGGLTSVTSGATIQGNNSTTDASTDLYAWMNNVIIGLLMEMQARHPLEWK